MEEDLFESIELCTCSIELINAFIQAGLLKSEYTETWLELNVNEVPIEIIEAILIDRGFDLDETERALEADALTDEFGLGFESLN